MPRTRSDAIRFVVPVTLAIIVASLFGSGGGGGGGGGSSCTNFVTPTEEVYSRIAYGPAANNLKSHVIWNGYSWVIYCNLTNSSVQINSINMSFNVDSVYGGTPTTPDRVSCQTSWLSNKPQGSQINYKSQFYTFQSFFPITAPPYGAWYLTSTDWGSQTFDLTAQHGMIVTNSIGRDWYGIDYGIYMHSGFSCNSGWNCCGNLDDYFANPESECWFGHFRSIVDDHQSWTWETEVPPVNGCWPYTLPIPTGPLYD